MAFCIQLEKLSEDNEFIYYNYSSYEGRNGKVKINRLTGNTYTVEYEEDDKGASANRACWSLMRHWKKGEFPDKAYWNS